MIVLATAAGRRLGYGKLVVRRRAGRALAAQLQLPDAERIRIVVDDAGAATRSSIDPLLTAVADTLLESNQARRELGFSVASAGDVNGDGYGDVIVGAPLYDAGETDEGAAFVFLGSASGIASGDARDRRRAARVGSGRRASFGSSVASAGDVNGDGYDDVIVGAPAYDAGQTRRGRGVRVPRQRRRASPSGNPATAHARLESDPGRGVRSGYECRLGAAT